jgi:hypothetical protein
MRFQHHYLLSLEERLGVNRAAVDSDYDHRKCDDRVTKTEKTQNMVNIQETQNKPILYRIAHILGRGLKCPDPPYPTSLDLSFPQKYLQVSWKSLTVLGMAI